jgi:hypothetical protein
MPMERLPRSLNFSFPQGRTDFSSFPGHPVLRSSMPGALLMVMFPKTRLQGGRDAGLFVSVALFPLSEDADADPYAVNVPEALLRWRSVFLALDDKDEALLGDETSGPRGGELEAKAPMQITSAALDGKYLYVLNDGGKLVGCELTTESVAGEEVPGVLSVCPDAFVASFDARRGVVAWATHRGRVETALSARLFEAARKRPHPLASSAVLRMRIKDALGTLGRAALDAASLERSLDAVDRSLADAEGALALSRAVAFDIIDARHSGDRGSDLGPPLGCKEKASLRCDLRLVDMGVRGAGSCPFALECTVSVVRADKQGRVRDDDDGSGRGCDDAKAAKKGGGSGERRHAVLGMGGAPPARRVVVIPAGTLLAIAVRSSVEKFRDGENETTRALSLSLPSLGEGETHGPVLVPLDLRGFIAGVSVQASLVRALDEPPRQALLGGSDPQLVDPHPPHAQHHDDAQHQEVPAERHRHHPRRFLSSSREPGGICIPLGVRHFDALHLLLPVQQHDAFAEAPIAAAAEHSCLLGPHPSALDRLAEHLARESKTGPVPAPSVAGNVQFCMDNRYFHQNMFRMD